MQRTSFWRYAVRRLLACSVAMLAGVWFGGTALAAAPVVGIWSTDFVPAAKFQRLQPLAAAAGVQLVHASPQALPAEVALVLFDSPRPNDREALLPAVEALTAAGTPWVLIGGGAPQYAGLPASVATRIAAYYAAGGATNYTHLFRYLEGALHAGSAPSVPAPQPAPRSGFYHPAATTTFATLDDYLRWGRARWPENAGVLALLAPASAMRDLQAEALDTLVSRTEADGLIPAVFWFDAQTQTLQDVLDASRIDVLVNLSHLQDGQARLTDFEALNVPVLQTAAFRPAPGEADWERAASGMPPRTLAVFLAAPESWGMSDPIVLRTVRDGQTQLLPAQLDALMGKVRTLVALRRTPPAEKRLATLFWNYPQGEQNLAASHLNLPRSLVSLAQGLHEAGYVVPVPEETEVIAQAQQMLGALYRPETLIDLYRQDLAAAYPVSRYRTWLQGLPPAQRRMLAHWGDPAKHRMVAQIDGVDMFLIPRWQLGHLTILPQLPRSGAPGQHYHDTAQAPDHAYLAAYLYVREQLGVHALIHLGTHGTQEWLPGKDRGLAATDFPFLAVGDTPVFYPYLQDNVGEAMQAKRRGRAVTISHQTPPFAPGGLYDVLAELHEDIHAYQQLDDGAVRMAVQDSLLEKAATHHLLADLNWQAADARAAFPVFLQQLHDHLHELARTAMPLGLHTFGQPAAPVHRVTTLMQQLGPELAAAFALDEEAWQDALQAGEDSAVWRWLRDQVLSAAPQAATTPLNALAQRARALHAVLADTQEMSSLLTGLAGGFVRPGPGGDPLRQPGLASGRNLYAFEADRLPSAAAYEAGGVALAQLLEAYAQQHAGGAPQRLAFSLWSSEAIRHFGVSEAQVLHALGLQPVWDRGGRLTALDIIPAEALGRPRIDVVIQATGVYRDQFDHFLQLLADAVERLAQLQEPGNVVAQQTQRAQIALLAQGYDAQAAAQGARRRIFSSAPDSYGTGVSDLVAQADAWDDKSALAQQFLRSQQRAFGVADSDASASDTAVFAAQLRGVDAVAMSRSSSVHGVLSTDHPFEFMGGLSAAIQYLDGRTPDLLVTDLRQAQPRTRSLQAFLADEMRVRYLNPAWIAGMQAEGYAGTLSVLAAVNNLYGWQAMDATTVRADQWQAMFDTYITDTRELGTAEWFDSAHPQARAQILERMAEAVRREYWTPSEATQQALAREWQAHAAATGRRAEAAVTQAFLETLAARYGLQAGSPPEQAANAALPAPSALMAAQAVPVQGQVLQASAAEAPTPAWTVLSLCLALLAGVGAGAFRYRRANRCARGHDGMGRHV